MPSMDKMDEKNGNLDADAVESEGVGAVRRVEVPRESGVDGADQHRVGVGLDVGHAPGHAPGGGGGGDVDRRGGVLFVLDDLLEPESRRRRFGRRRRLGRRRRRRSRVESRVVAFFLPTMETLLNFWTLSIETGRYCMCNKLVIEKKAWPPPKLADKTAT